MALLTHVGIRGWCQRVRDLVESLSATVNDPQAWGGVRRGLAGQVEVDWVMADPSALPQLMNLSHY
jgi:hypothetical protein